jgi:hypothetical protein
MQNLEFSHSPHDQLLIQSHLRTSVSTSTRWDFFITEAIQISKENKLGSTGQSSQHLKSSANYSFRAGKAIKHEAVFLPESFQECTKIFHGCSILS